MKKIADLKEIRQQLTAIARRQVTESVVLRNGEIIERKTQVRDSIKAMELLIKMEGGVKRSDSSAMLQLVETLKEPPVVITAAV